MDEGALASLLAVTSDRGSHAFQIAIASAALLAFVPLAAASRPRRARARDARLLAIGIVSASVSAAALPMLLRLPAAVAMRSFAPLQIGDRMAVGALIGFGLSVALVARVRGLSAARALDRLAVSMGVLVAAGRLGCFFGGCDFGSIARGPFTVTYPSGSHAFEAQLARGLVRAGDARALPVHPAQLYESLVGAAMIVTALLVARAQERGRSRGDGARPHEGAAFQAAIAVYGVGRFVVEVFRGDDRGALGPLSTPQWMAIALVAWAASGLASGRGARARSEASSSMSRNHTRLPN